MARQGPKPWRKYYEKRKLNKQGGSGSISAELRSILGRKGKPMKPEDAAKGTNPNHGKDGNKYTHNCQRCVYAFEERMRGYNVEAEAYKGGNTDEMLNGNWMRVYKGQTWEARLGNRCPAVKANIESKMKNWGDGSRAIVYVAWKTGYAHVFNVVQENGQTVAYDGQSGRRVSLERYINDAKPTKTMISRVDNLPDREDRMKYAIRRGQK